MAISASDYLRQHMINDMARLQQAYTPYHAGEMALRAERALQASMKASQASEEATNLLLLIEDETP